jgi:hypothetical protein
VRQGIETGNHVPVDVRRPNAPGSTAPAGENQMRALEINDEPKLDFRPWLGDIVIVWADVSTGERFRIRIGRKYATDKWGVPWQPRTLLEAFRIRKESVRALAEAAYLRGESGLDM